MNLTIVPIDGAVYVDGVSLHGLTFDAPQDIHALQWKATKGWVEFVDSDAGLKPANQAIDALPQWALDAKTKWDEAKAAEEAAAKAALEAAANQPTTQGAQTL
jgi:hypothetical protein